jgi:hypothetical protein
VAARVVIASAAAPMATADRELRALTARAGRALVEAKYERMMCVMLQTSRVS